MGLENAHNGGCNNRPICSGSCMLSLVDLRNRYLCGLASGKTAGIGYHIALIKTIAGRPSEDSPLLRELIDILAMKETASAMPDVCRVTPLLGQHPLLDACIFDLFRSRPDTRQQIPECIQRDSGFLTDQSCAAWCRLLLEQLCLPEHARAVHALLEKSSFDEELSVLQLALSAHYSGRGAHDSLPAARRCIQRIITENPASLALGIEAAKILTDDSLHLPKQTVAVLTRFIRKVEIAASLPVEKPINAYRSFQERLPFLKSRGVLIVQFLYYGDPDHSGAGTSGGLSTIVRDLGTALSINPDIAGVITVTVYDTAEMVYPYKPMSFVDEGHAILRMPLYLGNPSASRFIQLRGEIEREVGWITRTLLAYGPDVKPLYHMRYLDSAALASCIAAKHAGIPTVITLTPDPHRRIDRRLKEPQNHPLQETLNDFERIVTGDRLVEMADGIIGIGRSSITTSLLPYFPQLADMQDTQLIGIDEGIQVGGDYPPVDILQLLTNGESPLHINEAFAERPLIINIGRFHPAKGQTNLLRAWSEYGLWQHYNLLIIGGNFTHPNEHERETIDFCVDYISGHSDLKGKAALHPAIPNRAVRSLHSLLSQREIVHFPDMYVCSSLKEEFGLSIIEAMSAGMIVLAPLSGGAVEYIRHEINGFLIDTGSADSLGKDIVTCVEHNLVSPERIRAMQLNAKTTVERTYSLEKVAGDFLEFYNQVMEDREVKR